MTTLTEWKRRAFELIILYAIFIKLEDFITTIDISYNDNFSDDRASKNMRMIVVEPRESGKIRSA